MARRPRVAAAPAARAARAPRANGHARLLFRDRLMLAKWAVGRLGLTSFDQVRERLARLPDGLDEENVHHFARGLKEVYNRPELPDALLLEYDANIARHTERIAERRRLAGDPGADNFRWKYFQYVALLFTEIYLDRYFTDEAGLLESLNAEVAAFNRVCGNDADRVNPFTTDDLRKLAFWQATGSGKTLQMHVNLLQYLHYARRAGRAKEINRVLLLTPNSGLSEQHLRDFKISGIPAERFEGEHSLYSTAGAAAAAAAERLPLVEVMEITKLADKTGAETVAVSSFGKGNLVVVDEGHRGLRGGEFGAWKTRRGKLTEEGFTFEYSATFGQAVAGNEAQQQEYARSVLIDYSYGRFHEDGFGKDYQILNLAEDLDDTQTRRYLTACLLVFYQQMLLFEKLGKGAGLDRFRIDRPLWVFVGRTVSKKQPAGEEKETASDVVRVLEFLADVLDDRKGTIADIKSLLEQKSGLVDNAGQPIFDNIFTPLVADGATAAGVYDDLLKRFFRCSGATPGRLNLQRVPAADGEVALRCSKDGKPFGLINVGEPKSVTDACEEDERFEVSEGKFAEGLFKDVHDGRSPINILIGANKFTEGWSSFRVSTMGLLNMGQNEGPQIIQMFGRGVRLRGFDGSLKRTRALAEQPPNVPEHLELLETLNVFGVRANYMQQFKDVLRKENANPDDHRVTFVLPVFCPEPLKKQLKKAKIRRITLEGSLNFRKDGPRPQFGEIPEGMKPQHGRPVHLDWYPRVQVRASVALGAGAAAVKQRTDFSAVNLALLDWRALYFEVQRFKAESRYFNLEIAPESLETLLTDPSWYELYAPPGTLEATNLANVPVWNRIASALLKAYCERLYRNRQDAWEEPRRVFEDTHPEDVYAKNIVVSVHETESALIAKLRDLEKAVANGALVDVDLNNLRLLQFDRHLFQPLLWAGKRSVVRVSPVALNDGERDFVLQLEKYAASKPELLEDAELYLLRNMSRGRGMGFFAENNFYPDFILWINKKGLQHIVFAEPKGLTTVEVTDPKVEFYQRVKHLEAAMRKQDDDVRMHSFLITPTRLEHMGHWGLKNVAEFRRRHTLFLHEGVAGCVQAMIDDVLTL